MLLVCVCVCGRWVGFEQPGFSGECYVLEKGLYADPDDWGALSFKMSSIQPVFYVRAHFKQEDDDDVWFIFLLCATC